MRRSAGRRVGEQSGTRLSACGRDPGTRAVTGGLLGAGGGAAIGGSRAAARVRRSGRWAAAPRRGGRRGDHPARLVIRAGTGFVPPRSWHRNPRTSRRKGDTRNEAKTRLAAAFGASALVWPAAPIPMTRASARSAAACSARARARRSAESRAAARARRSAALGGGALARRAAPSDHDATAATTNAPPGYYSR